MGDTSYWQMMTEAISENREIVKQNKEEIKAMREANGEPVNVADKIKNLQLFHYGNSYDDRIEVKSGTITLLGNDFSSLYESSTTKQVQAQSADGTAVSVDVLRSTCSYPTEMHSSDLKRFAWSEYDTLTDQTKAAYEVTLLTKKYAAMPESDENAQAYANTMALYRQYCDANNISWNTVIHDVSTELQTEVSDYKVAADDKSDVYNQIGLSADKSRAQAADAHNLLLTCAPEGYEDALAIGLDSSITYEDTCDSSYDGSFIAHTAGFFAVVHGMFASICDKLPHPIEWAKTVFNNLKNEGKAFADNTKALMEDFDQQSDARIAEYDEIAQQFMGIKDDIGSTKAGQAADKAGDAISDEVQQTFEDPSQEIQDGRDWLKDKANQAAPYVDAAGNALDAAGDVVKERVDEFVDKWATPDSSPEAETEVYSIP